jgi:hypothetical protein
LIRDVSQTIDSLETPNQAEEPDHVKEHAEKQHVVDDSKQ